MVQNQVWLQRRAQQSLIMVICRWSRSGKWHGLLIGDEIYLRLVLEQARSFGHMEIDLTNTVFNGKVTEVGVVWLSIRLRSARPCATHAALGLLDGALGANKCYMHFLPVGQVFQAPKNRDRKGQTTWNRSAISLMVHTRRRIDLQHREGLFHVCDCISQLSRIEIRVCHQLLGVFRVDNTSEIGAMCHTRRRDKVLTAIGSGIVPQKDNPSWPSWF